VNELFLLPKVIYVMDDENDNSYPSGFTNEDEARETAKCISASVFAYIKKEECDSLLIGLQEKIAELEKEIANLNDDLLETQNQAREAEKKLEDIELFFCDEDGCPIIEPLTSDGLEKWLVERDIEMKIKGYQECIFEVAESIGEIINEEGIQYLNNCMQELRAEVNNG
jgi:DNA-binding transcriptional MerR regulator